MNLYLLENPGASWGEYDSFVVAAETAEDARFIHPGGATWRLGKSKFAWRFDRGGRVETNDWPPPGKVMVTLIGTAEPCIKAGQTFSVSLIGD